MVGMQWFKDSKTQGLRGLSAKDQHPLIPQVLAPEFLPLGVSCSLDLDNRVLLLSACMRIQKDMFVLPETAFCFLMGKMQVDDGFVFIKQGNHMKIKHIKVYFDLVILPLI